MGKLKLQGRLINILISVAVLCLAAVWAWELEHSLSDLAQRQEEALRKHQAGLLHNKGEELRDMFREIFQSTRTISLLPMIRSATGENRRNEMEDVVAQGRLSLDTHRTLQQVYANLEGNVSVSEVYYVLDGFDPSSHVPFFMYDGLIAGDVRLAQRAGHSIKAPTIDTPEESEEDEYRYFPRMLDRFRLQVPSFIWDRALDSIPAQISPLIRTCDNSQYHSAQYGNVRETFGFIYALPVYGLGEGRFKGMITTIIRANALEAKLVGVPFIPVTASDIEQQSRENWKMPAVSSFRLVQREHGIDIHDRRNHLFGKEKDLPSLEQGRLATISLELYTGMPWELSHYLAADEIEQLTGHFRQERQRIIVGRAALALLLLAAIAGISILIVRSRRELMRLAHFDSLTSLPNRRLFFDRLEQGIARARRNQKQLALFFVDIAGFNAINDTYGHDGGDRVLVGVAQRLQDALRGSDAIEAMGLSGEAGAMRVSRLGGGEFTIICEDICQGEDVGAIAMRLQEIMRVPFDVGRSSVEIHLNMGIALFPSDAQDSGKLLICADNAMQECRQQAAGYFLFNDDLRKRIERQHLLAVELGAALDRGQLQLFYQPKASLKDGRIVSVEALLRWRHPQLGMVSPVEFIPVLERTGGIIEVGAWVLEQSCRDIARLSMISGEVFRNIKVSVNVSVRQLRQGSFHVTAAEILDRTRTPPERVVLEVTESLVMENLEEGVQLLNELVELGMTLSIDDFGTGYSSLTYLQHLPLHYLKLDKAFIGAMSEPRAYHIVESVISLANGLNLVTIAEGIETEKQRNTLADLGCDIMQGYLLAKPMPFEILVGWLLDHQGNN